MCDLTDTIKPPLQDLSNFVSAIHKMSIFPSTILSKLPNLFLMELAFRYEQITLLRCEYRKRFKVILIFSSYSGLVVDASIKEVPFTCSTCLVLFHTFLKILIIYLQRYYFLIYSSAVYP